MIAPPSLKRGISWVTGWINLTGWVALVATNSSLASTLIINMISIYTVDYNFKRWHQFLIYIGYNIAAMLINAFGNSLLPLMNKTAIIWSITGFVVICITILACASPDYNSGHTVYEEFINETGWPGKRKALIL